MLDVNVGARGGAPTKSSPAGRGLGEGKDAFATFQQFNQSATKVLLSQATYANWLANRPYRSQRRPFFNEDYGDDWPDQCRATALPKTAQLIKHGWGQLFSAALKKSGSLKMRGYLRELTKADAPLKDIAAPRLVEVDQLVIKYYFAQAKALLRKHNFAATKAKYKQIIAEYPDSDAARRAEMELPKVVPVEVNYFQKQGELNFHPERKIGVPQKKAAVYYEKMYKADDSTGPKADIALYYWARALGTEGKVKQEVKLLQRHLNTFPRSKMRAQAMYLLGFTYCNHLMRDYKRGLPVLMQVVRDFPRSPEAPESLWAAAAVLAWQKQYARAISLLQQLKRDYPQSPRSKWVDDLIAEYKEAM